MAYRTYDLSEKDIYPFTQAASMDTEQLGNSMSFIRKNAANANVHDGLFVRPSNIEAIDLYLKENGLVQ